MSAKMEAILLMLLRAKLLFHTQGDQGYSMPNSTAKISTVHSAIAVGVLAPDAAPLGGFARV